MGQYMKNTISLLIVGMLILSGFTVASIMPADQASSVQVSNLTFSNDLLLTSENDYLTVSIDGVGFEIEEPGQPTLPVYRQTYTFPKDTKINAVDCTITGQSKQSISGVIAPAVTPVPLSKLSTIDSLPQQPDQTIYANDEYFPQSWFDYSITCGMDEKGILTTFVTVEVYPVRYNAVANELLSEAEATITIDYEENSQPQVFDEEYDMVIITSDEFVDALDRFVSHKESVGVHTYVKTVDEIYQEFSGVDEAEQIKYFIVDAKENHNITYVLLVGGLKSYLWATPKDSKSLGVSGFYVPARYTAVVNGDEKGCLSDLYYADLYKYDEDTSQWVFANWDSNENGIFAEYGNSVSSRDKMDLNPDVYYGRLAVRSVKELNNVIDKIITYESSGPSQKSWYNRMVAVGGRTFDLYEEKPDGEWACDYIVDLMDDTIVSEVSRCYSSNREAGGPTPEPQDVMPEISEGEGFLVFEGHGSPSRWNTHWADVNEEERTKDMKLYDILFKADNGEELPFVVVGGCHNGLFNVSFIGVGLYFLMGYTETYTTFWTPEPIPYSYSWAFVSKKDGGGIASTGCTGYGLGGGHPIIRSSELEANMFELIGNGTAFTPGQAHGGSITKYIQENSIRQTDTHCITIFELFADPSMRFGGYE